ncbi:MAG: efflux RND transporter periplasmic adaptor subunit [Rhizomicrobium sp.]
MLHAISRTFVPYIHRIRQHWYGSSRRTRHLLLAGGGIIIIIAGWQICAGLLTQTKPKSAAPVTVAIAQMHDVTVTEHSVGTVVAEATVNVTARVGGQIVAVAFKEGQSVHKGDLLFRLDPRPLKAALDEAAATLAKDRATAISNARTQARDKALLAAKAVSQQTYDADEATAKAAAATVLADKAALDTARLNLEYGDIRAPIDGKTGAIAVQIGNLVIANATTTLVTITQDMPVKVSFTLPQDRLGLIQKQIKTGKLTVRITPDGGDPITAPVNFVDNAVNQSAGTIELRASVANSDHRLVPGQMVSVDAALQNLTGVVVVPHNAVNPGQTGSYIFVIKNDKAKNDRAKQVAVKVLSDDGQIAAIGGKVRPGDTVITDGQLRVEDGGRVHIVRHGAGTANSAQTAPGAQ